jgi:hypothetical protein
VSLPMLMTEKQSTATRVKDYWRAMQQAEEMKKNPSKRKLKQYEVVERLIQRAFQHPETVKEMRRLRMMGILPLER